MSNGSVELNQIDEENLNDEEPAKSNYEFLNLLKSRKKNYVTSQYRIASISYCLISCLLSLVVATIEPLKTCIYAFFFKLTPSS